MSLAADLLLQFYQKTSVTPIDRICSMGWIVLQDVFIGYAGDERYHSPTPTQTQLDWLHDNCHRLSHSQKFALDIFFEWASLVL